MTRPLTSWATPLTSREMYRTRHRPSTGDRSVDRLLGQQSAGAPVGGSAIIDLVIFSAPASPRRRTCPCVSTACTGDRQRAATVTAGRSGEKSPAFDMHAAHATYGSHHANLWAGHGVPLLPSRLALPTLVSDVFHGPGVEVTDPFQYSLFA